MGMCFATDYHRMQLALVTSCLDWDIYVGKPAAGVGPVLHVTVANRTTWPSPRLLGKVTSAEGISRYRCQRGERDGVAAE